MRYQRARTQQAECLRKHEQEHLFLGFRFTPKMCRFLGSATGAFRKSPLSVMQRIRGAEKGKARCPEEVQKLSAAS